MTTRSSAEIQIGKRKKHLQEVFKSATEKTIEMPSVVGNLKQMIASASSSATAVATTSIQQDGQEETNPDQEDYCFDSTNEANDEENIVIDMEEEDDDDDEEHADEDLINRKHDNDYASSPSNHQAHQQPQSQVQQLCEIAQSQFEIGQLIWFDPNQLGYSIPGKIVDFYPELNVLTVEGCGQPLTLEDSQLDDLTRNRLLLKADAELQLYELSDQQAFRSIRLRQAISNELGFDNLLDLEELSLESVIYNLKLRQKQELVYTRCGHKILISLNPFKQLCDLYNLDQVNKYDSITLKRLDKLTRFNSSSQQELRQRRRVSSNSSSINNNSTLIKWLILNELIKNNNNDKNPIIDNNDGDFSASQQRQSAAETTINCRKDNDNCQEQQQRQQKRANSIFSSSSGSELSPNAPAPHIFQLANEALKKLLINCQDQCFILLGDSGSGKTESCKLLVQYFAAVNKAPTNLITEQILESIQVLESFGNAKTILNDNSSRFGKLLELRFNLRNGYILDAKTIDLNLLDRTRIVCQNENERNFHIFYELLAGLNKNEKEKYGLQTAEKYFYLNQGHCLDLPQKDDGEDFRSLLASMQVLGFNYEEQDTIFRILASILHLGNIYFHRKVLAIRSSKVVTTSAATTNENNNGHLNQAQAQPPPAAAQQSASSIAGIEGVEIGSDTEVRWVSHLLQVQFDLVMRCLTVRTTPETPSIHHHHHHNNNMQQPTNHQSSNEHAAATIVTPLNIDQALDTRDAIARALYTCLFKWLAQRINVMINSNSQSSQGIDDADVGADDESIEGQQQTKSDNNNNRQQQQNIIKNRDQPIYMCKTSESLCEFQPDKLTATNSSHHLEQHYQQQQHYLSSSSRGGSRRSRAACNDGYSPINQVRQQQQQRAATISILDAFGFENLIENNFEQLCINYAAELMNYHTNRYLSGLEQAEYVRERLRWQPIGQHWTKLQQQQANNNNSNASSNSLTSTMTSNSQQATATLSSSRAPASIVNLISRKPLGILALLDDECNFPKATDQSFAEKCHHNHALNENYQCARLAANSQEFGVRHFRQVNRMVWYQVDGFIEKNRDSLRPDVVELLVGSRMTIVADMLRKTHPRANGDPNGNKTLSRTFDGRYVSMKPRATTVATRFQDTIHHNKVMDTLTGALAPSTLIGASQPQQQQHHYINGGDSSLSSSFRSASTLKQQQQQISTLNQQHAQSSNAWFIMCLKPNRSKTAQVFDVAYVQEQVKSINLLEIAEMRKFGFPVRLRYNEFVRRFRCLVPSTFLTNLTTPVTKDKSRQQQRSSNNKQQSIKKAIRDVCSSIVEYKFHHQFNGTLEAIEAVKGQYQCGLTKMFLNEKLFHQLEQWRLSVYQESIMLLQKCLRMWLIRREYLLKRRAAIVLQAHWRAHLARKSFWHQYSLIVLLQRRWRDVIVVRRKQRLVARRKALKQQEQFRLQELREQQRKQANQFRYRLTTTTSANQQNHYYARGALLEIPEDLTQLYRLQRNWQPVHDLSNINEFNLLNLVEKELRSRESKQQSIMVTGDQSLSSSVPFVVIDDDLMHLHSIACRKQQSTGEQVTTTSTKHQQVTDYIEQLELDERYSLHNFLSKYYTNDAPQFGYSRLPITRPFTWSKLMRLKQLETQRRKAILAVDRSVGDGDDTDQQQQSVYRQQMRLVKRRFAALEQKSVAIYKLILRYIDSDQSLPILTKDPGSNDDISDNDDGKFNPENDDSDKQFELVQKLLKFKLISDYINYLCLTEPLLRNEVYLQLCSQSWQNPKLRSVENTWKLFLNCLSCFKPIGSKFNKFLLKYANDFCCDKYRKLICTKLWHNSVNSHQQDQEIISKQRRYPTTIIEYWANQFGVEHLGISASCYMDDHALNEQAAIAATTTTLSNNEMDETCGRDVTIDPTAHLSITNFSNKTMVKLDSNTSAEQFARQLLATRSIPEMNLTGWSVEIQHEGALSEHSSRLRGDDQLLDHFARLELLPELVQLIDDDFEAFECEQLDLMFGFATTTAVAASKLDSNGLAEQQQLQSDACCRQATTSPTHGGEPTAFINNPRISATNYSQFSYDSNPAIQRRPLSTSSSQYQQQSRRHSAAISAADYDAYSQRTPRSSRQFARQDLHHQQLQAAAWSPREHQGFDDDYYQQQQQYLQQHHYHHRTSSSLSNQRRLNRRSMSMQELQLASSALNGRYFVQQQQPQQFPHQYGQARSNQSPNSPDCCRNIGAQQQVYHRSQQPFVSNKRLSGSLRQLEMSAVLDDMRGGGFNAQQQPSRHRSGTPNSASGYQSASSRTGQRLSSSVYGGASSSTTTNGQQHYQQVTDDGGPNDNIDHELLAHRQQQTRFARQQERFHMLNEANKPKRRSLSSSSRTAVGPTSDYASTHHSDYERIGMMPPPSETTPANQRLRATGGSPNKFRPPPQLLPLHHQQQQHLLKSGNLNMLRQQQQQQQMLLQQQQRDNMRSRSEWDHASLSSSATNRTKKKSADRVNNNNNHHQATVHYATSSAMSDTSEAPSLASHVRGVKVPQPNGDLDRYLDDLFNPLLDEVDLDELSDARSLATSIRGRIELKEEDAGMNEVLTGFENLCNPSVLSRIIQGRPSSNGDGVAGQANEAKPSASNEEGAESHSSRMIAAAESSNQHRLSRANLSPTFESLLESLKTNNDFITTTTAADDQQPTAAADLDKLNLCELKALNERLESEIQAAQSARPTLELIGGDSTISSNIPIPPPQPSFSQHQSSSAATITTATSLLDDVYSRAKTIRIGKWRWPPALEDTQQQQSQLPTNGNERKRASLLDHDELNGQSVSQSHREDGDGDDEVASSQDDKSTSTGPTENKSNVAMIDETSQQQHLVGSELPVAITEPAGNVGCGGAVGRLKISSEMKAKLEQLTNSSGNVAPSANNSGGGNIVSQAKDLIESSKLSQEANADSDASSSKQPRRLNEQRKNLLEIQLLGCSGSNDNSNKQILSTQEATAENRHMNGRNSPTSPSGSKVLAVKQKLAAAAGVALTSLDCNSGASSQASSRRQSSNILGVSQQTTTSGPGDDNATNLDDKGQQQQKQQQQQQHLSSRHFHNDDELGPQTRAAISQRQTFYRISASSDRLDQLRTNEPIMRSVVSSSTMQVEGDDEFPSSHQNNSEKTRVGEHHQFVGGLQPAQLSRATPIASDLNEAGRTTRVMSGKNSSTMIERLCGKQGRPTNRDNRDSVADNQWISTSCSPSQEDKNQDQVASSSAVTAIKSIKTKTLQSMNEISEPTKKVRAPKLATTLSTQQTGPPITQQHQQEKVVTANCLSHANVDWQVRIRKELFRPSESYDDPMVMQLIFAQLVADVFNPRHWTRLNNKERAAMKSMMKDQSIGYSPSLPPIGQMQPVKRDLIKMARSFGLYFTRSYQALNFVCLADGHPDLLPPNSNYFMRNRKNSHNDDDDDEVELSAASSIEKSSSDDDDDADSDDKLLARREERKSTQLARELYRAGGLGLDWIDLVAVHHSGLRLVSMVDNLNEQQQQQQQTSNTNSMLRNQYHQIESSNNLGGPTAAAAATATTTPPIGYKVLETLKFRDMTNVSLLCKQKLVFVNMRNGRKSWLLSSSQASQLASLLKSFHLDYNEQVRSSTSNQVVNSSSASSLLKQQQQKQENHNNSAEVESGIKRLQKQQNNNKQQVAAEEKINHYNKTRSNKLQQQTIGSQLEEQQDKENALLATDDGHHGDHLKQRQAPNSVDKLHSPAHANNVLADCGRVLSNTVANSTTSSNRNQQVPANSNSGGSNKRGSLSLSAASSSPSSPARGWGPDSGGSGCRKCGLARGTGDHHHKRRQPADDTSVDQQLQPICTCQLDANNGGSDSLHAGGRSNGGKLQQQQSTGSKSKLSPDNQQQQQQQQPTKSSRNSLDDQDRQQSVSEDPNQDQKQSRKESSKKSSNQNSKQTTTTNSGSLWQNSLSRMSNKLNIFSNSSKRKSSASTAANEARQNQAAKASSSGSNKQLDQTGEQEPVVLDAWIETKVDFDEEELDEDSSDEHPLQDNNQADDRRQSTTSTSTANQQQLQDDKQRRRTSSTGIESGSLSQLKLKQRQQFKEPSSNNNNDAPATTTQKPDDGKYSMLQFALYNFREAIDKYSLAQKAKQHRTNEKNNNNGDTNTLRGSLKLIEFLRDGPHQGETEAAAVANGSSIGSTSTNGQPTTTTTSSNKDTDWTWRELAEMVKYTQTPIKRSLLKLPPNQDDLDRRAVECFAAIMQYMGDMPAQSGNSKHQQQQQVGGDVECVYLILINCHNYPILRDEIYCQLIKQTTNNRSQRSSDSCLLGWRLFSIVAAYFDCSQMFKPYLMKYLEQAAYDKRRAYHSIASLCLQNLRKTFKFKGRKNVPSIEEIAATTAGRNSKRQIYRLPGGTERVINTNSTTVVEDIIYEICSNMLNVADSDEMLEYSLYCIADGDLYTMPLNRDEYILDITTELIKNHQQYFLIFCRSIWHYPLRLDSQLYIEVIFNQIAPDYLEGLLLILPKHQHEKIYSGSSTSSGGGGGQNAQLVRQMVSSSSASSAAGSHSLSSDSTASHHHSHHHQKRKQQDGGGAGGPLRLKMKLVKEIARLAALLHRAYGSDYIPHKDEIKYLLPKTIVALLKQQHQRPILTNDHRLSSASSVQSNRSSNLNDYDPDEPKLATHSNEATTTKSNGQHHNQIVVSSQKWIELVQENCRELNAIDSLDAKAQFLDIVRHWPLFGSSFFAIKLIQRDLIQPMDFILALNKLGIQMLDIQTHETVHQYQFNEVISTRKVRSEDGALFLDMKCGNLMKRTIIRIQTDQAHEISRLIRQYIDIEILQANKNNNKPTTTTTSTRNVISQS